MAKNNQTDLLGAYLICGENALKREAAIKRLRVRIEELGDLSFNYDAFSGEGATGQDIVSACNTMPFACEKRLVYVDNVDKLKKNDLNALLEYLKDPAPTTVLALVAEKTDKRSKLYSAVKSLGPQSVIECDIPKGTKLSDHVVAMAKSHGLSLSQKGASRLIELIGDDTVHLDNELNKLSLILGEDIDLGEGEIDRYVAQITEPKPWEFVNAFSSRNLPLCVEMIGKMRSTSPHSLIAMTVSRIRELICARSLLDRRCASTSALADELNYAEWKLRNHFNWASKFETAELKDMLIDAMHAERKMKSGSDAETAFLEWTIDSLKR